jgi:NADH-quinone oxidoreductase subunit A
MASYGVFDAGWNRPSENNAMLENWLPILIFFVLIAGFAAGNIVISWVMGVQKPNPLKLTAYESGMNPIGDARERYSVQFYVVAMLFLLFDVEAIFLFPWAVVFRELRLVAFVEMLVFIGVILAGFVYVWKKGALEWDRR